MPPLTVSARVVLRWRGAFLVSDFAGLLAAVFFAAGFLAATFFLGAAFLMVFLGADFLGAVFLAAARGMVRGDVKTLGRVFVEIEKLGGGKKSAKWLQAGFPQREKKGGEGGLTTKKEAEIWPKAADWNSAG